jgi:lambda family phage tail tape measure protein
MFLDKELSTYAKMLGWISEKLKGMRAAAGDISKSDLWKEIEMLRSLEAKGMAAPGLAAAKEAEWNRRFLAPQLGLKPAEELKRRGSWSTPGLDPTSLTEAEKKDIIAKREAWLKEQAESAKRTMETLTAEVRKYQEEFTAALMGQSRLEEYLAGGQDQNAIARMEYERLERIREEAKKVYGAAGSDGDYITRHREQIGPYEAERVKRTLDEIRRQGEESMGQWVELSERTADAIEQNFSDLFFDAWQGNLKSASDYFKAFSDSIGRMASDLAGQMLKTGLFGAGGNGQQIGGLFGMLFGGGSLVDPYGHAKGGVFDAAGHVPFARGGVVNRPTLFPFAAGVGLMGEAGPEGILPLKRTRGGNLGVEASGGGVQVIVNNNSPERASVREARGPDGMRQIFVTIGADIANGGPVARAMEQTYGVKRVGRVG